MARKVRTEEEDAQIDMTPMLDVVFIMLIFFIVTTVFVKEAATKLKICLELAPYRIDSSI